MTLRNYLFTAGLLASSVAAFGQATDAGAPAMPKTKWESSAALGVTITGGNTKTVNVVGDLQTARKWDLNELSMGLNGNYGENDGEKNSEQLKGYIQYNRLFQNNWFAYLRADALHDGIADVEYRLTLSPGVGYYFIKNKDTSLRAEAGPGYVFERVANRDADYASLRLAERLDHKFNDRVKIWESVEFLPQIDDWNNFVVNAEVGLETGLSSRLNLRTYVQDTYDNEPAPHRQKNDIKFVTAIAYKF